jgi:hypothetical protein
MGKLVIKHQGNKIDDVNLRLGDTVIGRDPACDIVLKDDKSVSKKHAVIKTVGMKSSIEDLGSTNGTFLGHRRIRRHDLKSGDSIVIGEHELVYRDEVSLDAPTFGARPGAPAAPATEVPQEKTKIITAYSQLIGVIGDQRGRRIPLVKDETVIDNPGKSPARIYRTPDGFVLSAQVGPGEPRINDRPVPPGGQILESGDVIEVAGTKYQFTK